MHDYINKHPYVTSKARVASQRHLSIRLDLSNPIVLRIYLLLNDFHNGENYLSAQLHIARWVSVSVGVFKDEYTKFISKI